METPSLGTLEIGDVLHADTENSSYAFRVEVRSEYGLEGELSGGALAAPRRACLVLNRGGRFEAYGPVEPGSILTFFSDADGHSDGLATLSTTPLKRASVEHAPRPFAVA